MDSPKENKVTLIKNFYFYLVSFAALMMIVISVISLLNTILTMTVFPKADYYGGIYVSGCEGAPAMPGQPTSSPEYCAAERTRQEQDRIDQQTRSRQMSFVWTISMLVVAIPLFIFHWRIARRKENN